jgi:hypothetical protein
MEDHAGQVMAAGRASEKLGVQLVTKPRQRVPIRAQGGEGEGDCVRLEPVRNVSPPDVCRVIEVDEAVADGT